MAQPRPLIAPRVGLYTQPLADAPRRRLLFELGGSTWSSKPVTTVIHPLSGGGYRGLSGALRSQELSTLALARERLVTDFDTDGCMVRIDLSMQPA
jgi:hypothetical protein